MKEMKEKLNETVEDVKKELRQNITSGKTEVILCILECKKKLKAWWDEFKTEEQRIEYRMKAENTELRYEMLRLYSGTQRTLDRALEIIKEMPE